MSDSSIHKHGGFHPNYIDEIEYFNQNKVYSIQIEVTTACEGGCFFCYASEKNQSFRHMSIQDVYAILDAATNLNVKCIDWLGGDPLLHPDWVSLMTTAQRQGLTNNIWTSGLPLADPLIAQQAVELSYGGFISVHLDTLNETIYQKLHGGKPSDKIARILKGVENVQHYGKSPDHMLNCIAFNKLLATDAEKTISYFFTEKGMRTCLTQMCPTGLAETHPEWIPTPQEIQNAINARDRINYPNTTLSISSMDTNKFYCGGIVCVTIDGEVTPCSVIRKGVGNIHTTPLTEIIHSHKDTLLFSHLRQQENLPTDCSDCENNSVCWGCRATAFYHTQDSCAMDPNCYKIQKKIAKTKRE
ncbi:MAG: radical SAM protein [Candidatus Thermoplasmatota archaeon]|nr:radical SAM protein [Candidatus Thermoplasmatota archaeon]MBU1941885.1 radical SAM protein [Candidatus Thermoplasmatota archaeon]